LPKSKVITEAVDSVVPLEQTLRRLEVLAHDVGNDELERWAECELAGYTDGEVPSYRVSKGLNFSYSGINNGTFKVNSAPLQIYFLSEKTLDNLKEVPFAESISSVEKLAEGESTVHIDRSYLASEVFERSDGGITCLSISQNVSPDFFKGIKGEVTTRAIKALMMLEDEYGCLDELGIEIKSTRETAENNTVINNTVLNTRAPGAEEANSAEKEGLGSKVAWNVMVPIITAVAGSLVTALLIRYFQL
jgi:hypothetical protein